MCVPVPRVQLTQIMQRGQEVSSITLIITLILTLMQDAAADREVGLITLIITGWTGLIARSGPQLTVNKSW